MAKEKQIDSESELEDSKEMESSEASDGESEADADVSDTNEDDNENGLTNSAWADSISKILKTNKPKRKKTLVLSKAKKLTDVKKDKSKPAGFEVQTVDGEVKEEKIEGEDDHKEEPPQKKKRVLTDLRVKPNILDKDRERILQKIATKGVVQLFNAVKTQQRQISEKLKEAGPLEVRKEKVLKNIDKRAFLDVLMGEKSHKIDDFKVQKTETNINDKEKPDSMWSVLKDDFMLSAKMKDWDKQLSDTDDVEKVVESI